MSKSNTFYHQGTQVSYERAKEIFINEFKRLGYHPLSAENAWILSQRYPEMYENKFNSMQLKMK